MLLTRSYQTLRCTFQGRSLHIPITLQCIATIHPHQPVVCKFAGIPETAIACFLGQHQVALPNQITNINKLPASILQITSSLLQQSGFVVLTNSALHKCIADMLLDKSSDCGLACEPRCVAVIHSKPSPVVPMYSMRRVLRTLLRLLRSGPPQAIPYVQKVHHHYSMEKIQK